MENEFFSVEPTTSSRPAWHYRAGLAAAILVVFLIAFKLTQPTTQISGNYNGYLGSAMSDNKIGFTAHLDQVGGQITGSGQLSWIRGNSNQGYKLTLTGRISGSRLKLSGATPGGMLYLNGDTAAGGLKEDYRLKITGNYYFKGGGETRQPGGFLLKK